MQRVVKSPEPVGFMTWRQANRSASWADLQDPEKAELRTQLVADQDALCCYCQRRIRDSRDATTIEHFVPRSGGAAGAARELDWSNLLAACTHTRGLRPAQQTCDVRKGDRPCSQNPLALREDHISYDALGRIHVSGDHIDVDDVLNLNESRLRGNRKAALDGFVLSLQKKGFGVGVLRREAEALEEARPGTPYRGYLLFWLRKRLRQRT